MPREANAATVSLGSWPSLASTAGVRASISTLAEVAKQVGVDSACVCRMMNLTTLAPDIVEAILDESLPSSVTLFDLASNTPLLWEKQQLL